MCLNKPEIVWEFQTKKSKNSEKIQMRKTSQSAIKTQKYLLKKEPIQLLQIAIGHKFTCQIELLSSRRV